MGQCGLRDAEQAIDARPPSFLPRIGQCYIGGVLFVLSAWIRYAGTANGLSSGSAYALILVGQVRDPTLRFTLAAAILAPPPTVVVEARYLRLTGHFPRAQIIAGITQPIFQVLIPGYSEKWFDLRGRTTATMLMSIGKPSCPWLVSAARERSVLWDEKEKD